MKLIDCVGKRVKMGKPMTRAMMPHNAATFSRLETAIKNSNGSTTFEHLVSLCDKHEHGTKSANHPYQFITYCLKPENGWLELTE